MKAVLAGAALLLALAACQEKLTSPADCPSICPGGKQAVLDTVLEAAPNGDTTFVGYVGRGAGTGLVLATGLPIGDSRGLVRFAPLSDSVTLSDTARAITSVDSVTFTIGLQVRDTLMPSLRVLLYRIPVTIDSTTTFAATDPIFADPANLVDSIAVPDTMHNGSLRIVFTAADLAKLTIPPADSGVLALGLVVHGPQPTGLRVSANGGTVPPTLTRFVHVNVADTTLAKQTQVRGAFLTTYVNPNAPPGLDPDPNLLTVGGAPSARSILRFTLPPLIRDTATIVRATLELIPAAPIAGVPGVADILEARPIVADLGKKSPVDGTLFTDVLLPDGSSDTVRIEVTRFAARWQGVGRRPAGLFLALTPEGSTFGRVAFNSTRSPVGRPRLRITYQLPFPFEKP